ncbi:MAG: hypothetical protein KF819_29770 [Labilithrix sp.]|nr:hypothetical protein [Labilithrix sp.]
MSRSALLVCGLALLGGCNRSMLYAPPPPLAEPVTVKVEGDPSEPVAGAAVFVGERLLAETDATGVARFALEGIDGTKFDVSVQCPMQNGGALRSLKVILRRGSRPPEYATSCKRTTHATVVLVNAPGGAGIPVLHLGREIARVDDAGLALVHLDVAVGETFTLMLDTRDPKYKNLRPQNPETAFAGAESDEIYVFDTKLHEERPVVRRIPRPPPHVPQRLVAD